MDMSIGSSGTFVVEKGIWTCNGNFINDGTFNTNSAPTIKFKKGLLLRMTTSWASAIVTIQPTAGVTQAATAGTTVVSSNGLVCIDPAGGTCNSIPLNTFSSCPAATPFAFLPNQFNATSYSTALSRFNSGPGFYVIGNASFTLSRGNVILKSNSLIAVNSSFSVQSLSSVNLNSGLFVLQSPGQVSVTTGSTFFIDQGTFGFIQ